MLFEKGLNQLINCAGITKRSKVLIICDSSTVEIGKALFDHLENDREIEVISCSKIHGEEPPTEIAEKMLNVDVIFGLTKMSMAHTSARQSATSKGIRYLSLPDYSIEVISRRCMHIDFASLVQPAELIANKLTLGSTVKITTVKGTNITCNIKDRSANAAPGLCNEKYLLASPPDAETNIAPVEYDSNGILVVDGSIPHPIMGLMSQPLTLYIEKGKIIHCTGGRVEEYINIYQEYPANAKILAELGIGLNPNAQLCGSMLEDEGCYGTVHFGFGSNNTIGGKNKINFHLDHIILNPIVEIDGKRLIF